MPQPQGWMPFQLRADRSLRARYRCHVLVVVVEALQGAFVFPDRPHELGRRHPYVARAALLNREVASAQLTLPNSRAAARAGAHANVVAGPSRSRSRQVGRSGAAGGTSKPEPANATP